MLVLGDLEGDGLASGLRCHQETQRQHRAVIAQGLDDGLCSDARTAQNSKVFIPRLPSKMN